MWTEVDISDMPQLEQCAHVMRGVDRSYARFDAKAIVSLMFREGARVLHFVGVTFQIVIIVEYAKRMKQWRVKTMGISGSPPVNHAFNIAAAEMKSFFQKSGADEFFVIVRTNLDNPFMNAFAEYAVSSSEFDVTIEHQMNDCDAVRFRLPPTP